MNFLHSPLCQIPTLDRQSITGVENHGCFPFANTSFDSSLSKLMLMTIQRGCESKDNEKVRIYSLSGQLKCLKFC